MTYKIINIFIFFIIIFFLSNIFLLDNSCRVKGENILFVGGSAPGNYSSIQNAIDNSSKGDTVFVYNGLYKENIVINKSINLIGENNNFVIIDSSQQIYSILMQSPGINISGFNIQNSQIGIFITNLEYSYINISENIFTYNQEGIRIYNSSNILIMNNVIQNNNEFGIVIYESKNIEITGNIIFQNFRGIYLGRWSNFNKISKNNCSENNFGLYIDYSFNNSIIDNDILINNWGVFLKNSNYNNISNNNIEGNEEAGLALDNSEDNILLSNYFDKNQVDIKEKPKPPNIKAPGFEFFLLLFGILIVIGLKNKYL